MGRLKKKKGIKVKAAGPRIFFFIFDTFSFLVRILHLQYITHNATWLPTDELGVSKYYVVSKVALTL